MCEVKPNIEQLREDVEFNKQHTDFARVLLMGRAV